MSEIPAAARTVVDAALVAAARDLSAGSKTPDEMKCRIALGAALGAREVAGNAQDAQVLASMLGTLDEALRGISGNAHHDPRISAALGRLEGARQILAPHIDATQDSIRIENVSRLLRELHQVIGDLHVRLFIDASTRERLAPLIQLAREDVGFLRQQFGYGGKFGDPWHTRHVMTRIHAELMAMEVHDERSRRALSDTRRLMAEILAIAKIERP